MSASGTGIRSAFRGLEGLKFDLIPEGVLRSLQEGSVEHVFGMDARASPGTFKARLKTEITLILQVFRQNFQREIWEGNLPYNFWTTMRQHLHEVRSHEFGDYQLACFLMIMLVARRHYVYTSAWTSTMEPWLFVLDHVLLDLRENESSGQLKLIPGEKTFLSQSPRLVDAYHRRFLNDHQPEGILNENADISQETRDRATSGIVERANLLHDWDRHMSSLMSALTSSWNSRLPQ